MSEEQENPTQTPPLISPEFIKIIKDFVTDVKSTFPEYAPIIDKWWKVETDEEGTMKMLYSHCINVVPERMFDILYQNADIFAEDSEINTEFLPGISFKFLWNCEISNKTRETIWKYLQMLMISIVGNIQDKSAFGESSAKMFDSIDENDFKDKLHEALGNIQSIFENDTTNNSENNENTDQDNDSSSPSPSPNPSDESTLPSVDSLHDHITGMLGGKLGKLAQEIAEETTANLDLDLDNITNPADVFKSLMSNPGKLMNIVKDVGNKLDSKMNSGEINKSELMAEATEMMNNMKNIPGMNNIQQMMSKMGLPNPMNHTGATPGGDNNDPNMNDMANMMQNMPDIEKMMKNMGMMGRNTKINKNAMESQLKQLTKVQQMKDRMKKNMNERIPVQNMSVPAIGPCDPVYTDEQLVSIFSTGETYEKTPRNTNQDQNTGGGKKKPKSKGKGKGKK